MDIQPIATIDGLEPYSNLADLHHDLLVYVDYVGSRSVKRSSRDNNLPKNDQKELGKRLTYPVLDDIKSDGKSSWLAFVEFLARQMRLVSFGASKGVEYFYESYSGYGYADNYVVVNERNLKDFWGLSDVEQEETIRQALVNMPLDEYNEWFDDSPLGMLDHFGSWGRTSTTAPQADFPGARRLLLDTLGSLQSGVWYSTASLIDCIKRNAPYFLLPKRIIPSRHQENPGRYAGFTESRGSGQWSPNGINELAPDAFERVEGRFIERFLEALPLLLRYVELAYHPGPAVGNNPQRDLLRAFRVNDRFLHLMRGKTPPAQVTAQPNYEVVLVSEVYPYSVLSKLLPMGEIITASVGQSGPSVFTLRLKRERVTAQAALQPGFDPVGVLRGLSNQELAQNVVTELREWTARSDVFTLYEGFTLLETDEAVDGLEGDSLVGLLEVEIAPGLRILRQGDKAFQALEKLGRVPLTVTHPDESLGMLPDSVQTVFATPSRTLRRAPKVQPVTVKREERVTLRLSNRDAFDALRQALVELRIPVETDDRAQAITYAKEFDVRLAEAVQAIADRFAITIS